MLQLPFTLLQNRTEYPTSTTDPSGTMSRQNFSIQATPEPHLRLTSTATLHHLPSRYGHSNPTISEAVPGTRQYHLAPRSGTLLSVRIVAIKPTVTAAHMS